MPPKQEMTPLQRRMLGSPDLFMGTPHGFAPIHLAFAPWVAAAIGFGLVVALDPVYDFMTNLLHLG